MRFRSPGYRAIAIEIGIGFPEQQLAIVLFLEQRICHVSRNIVRREIERNAALIPGEFAFAQLEIIYRQRK